MKTLKELLELRSAAFDKIDACKTEDELRAAELEIAKLDRQIKEAKEAEKREAEQDDAEARDALNIPEKRDTPKDLKKILGGGADPEKRDIEDPRSTLEYRTDFMKYMQGGEYTDLLRKEARADTFTSAADASAVIPNTILNELIKELKVRGQIYSLVRKLNIAGGVSIPILTVKPTAKWVPEGTSGDRQKIKADESVTFNYYQLECKVAQSLVAHYASLPMFEAEFTALILEAIITAIENAVINGTGNKQPLGIVKDSRVKANQKLTIPTAEVSKWDAWKKKVFAKIPLSYTGGIFVFTKGTFDGYIDGMVDANGQPIGRVNYGIDGQTIGLSFGGVGVVLVENDLINDWDTAAAGDVVGLYFLPKDYIFNSNMNLNMVKWMDQDTNQLVNKGILIGDGKLGDTGSVLILLKGE